MEVLSRNRGSKAQRRHFNHSKKVYFGPFKGDRNAAKQTNLHSPWKELEYGITGSDPLVDKGRYQRLVGRLIYLSLTRPDIAYATSIVSQFMHSPTQQHMNVVYHMLRYMKGIPSKGLLFMKTNNRGVEGFADTDWTGSIVDSWSTFGFYTKLWVNLVTWRSKK